MNSEELRALQAPLKDRYRSEPQAAQTTLTAQGRLLTDQLACEVNGPAGTIRSGLHPLAGGSGEDACSGDMLLQALVACAGVTLAAVATALGITIRSGSLQATGELDFRGTLGVDRDVAVGFSHIQLEAALDTDADAEQIAKLLKLTERYCVVHQTLGKGVEMSLVLADASAHG